MAQYASFTSQTNLQCRTVYGSKASELELRANQAIAAMLAAGAQSLVNLRLSGCGDGKLFALHLEAVDTASLDASYFFGEGAFPGAPLLATVYVTCFQAGHPRDLEAKRTLALGTLASRGAVSTDIAGAEKDTAIMGAIVSIPNPSPP
ncbi:MAG: hypothetical protein WC803_13550 [Sphingomonas sp.]|jgi:hypothetical protein